MFKLSFKTLLVILFLTSFISCKHEAKKTQIEKASSDSLQNNSIKRYEKALFALDIINLQQGLAEIAPEFKFFLGDNWQDTINIRRIHNYLTDKNIKEIYETTIQKYPNLNAFEPQLQDALTTYKEYFPTKPTPKVYTYVSGLDIETPIYFFDTAMAIGLDLFLGADAEVYKKAGIPVYKSARCIPECILPQCMLAVSDHLVRIDPNNNTLLSQMITAGKALYFLDVMLPNSKDWNKIGYTQSQWEWCNKNENNIWSLMISQQLLFTSNQQAITKFMSDAPFTSGFDRESPARLGAYVGWQIVKKYMSKNTDITLNQLMENTDEQLILKESGYKPMRK